MDLGLDVTLRHKFRLRGIDAWEVRGKERPKGLVARDWLREQIPAGSTVYLKTHKDKVGKFGRFVTDVYIRGDDGAWRDLNKELVELGHAEFVNYD